MWSRRAAAAAVVAVAAVSMTAGACGSGSGARAAGGTSGVAAGRPVPAGSVDDFCNGLDQLNSTEQQAGLDRRLASVRTDLRQSATEAGAVVSAGVPDRPGIQPFLARLVPDLRNISLWLDTRATQADLDADRVPPDVRRSMDDMGYDFRQLQRWADANCKNQQQGDGH
ncbi:MAG TPA: hypothetical protein VFJ79_01135 [Acidimicrobiales bacterium]|nr:hypothetical protein [Acidimicrobiales bacterium]